MDVSAYVALGQQIEVGEHVCPECGQRLGGWGGYWRWVRGAGTERLWIRRGRCSSCRRSHALLPDFLLERRLDEVHVIGQALGLSIAGRLGMRPVARRLGVPMTTARDWRRRFRVNALIMATSLVALAVQLDPAAVLLKAANNETLALEVRQVPQAQPPTPPPLTGVDYLGLVLAAHDSEKHGQLAFRDLPVQQPEEPQS